MVFVSLGVGRELNYAAPYSIAILAGVLKLGVRSGWVRFAVCTSSNIKDSVDAESGVGFLCGECGEEVGSILFVCYVARELC